MNARYSLSAVRLINWHNFVDETISVDGSLFLIGDNGSGKTTLLDAVHCALTGDWKVELNAAARVGGRRDDGRDLAGIVLRKHIERGFQRADGAVAYAALEFRHIGSDARQSPFLSLGIGVYVASPESRPEKWGFLAATPLADVPLVVDAAAGGDGGGRPADRTELQARLPAGSVLDVGRYRTRVGEKLFGSRQHFEQVAVFLQAGKAYRELVAKTANFSDLFSRLLPIPDIDTFHDVRSSLEAIEHMRLDLKGLDEELERLRRLLDWQEKVAQEREAVLRYDYLEALHAKERAEIALADAKRRKEDAEKALAETERRRAEVEAAVEGLETELERLRNSRGADLLGRLRELRTQLQRESEERDRLAARLDEATERAAEREAELAGAVTAVRQRAEPMHATVERVAGIAASAVAPEALARLGELAESLRALARDPAAAPFDFDVSEASRRAVRAAIAGRRLELRDEERAAQEEARLATAEGEEAEREADELRQRGEVPPPLASLEEALRRLAAEGIAAQPLYKVLEPRGKMSLEELGYIERALGPRLLGTLITSVEDHARAKTVLLSSTAGVPLADLVDGDAPRGTIEEAFGAGARDATVFERLEAAPGEPLAEAFLRHHTASLLWQREAPADGEFLTRSGHLHHRRFDERLETAPARWLGATARRKALEQALAACEERAAAAHEKARGFRAAARRAAETAKQLAEAEAALEELELVPLAQALTRRDELARALELARRDVTERREELAHVETRRGALARSLETVEREVAEAGLETMAARMDEIETELQSGRLELKRVHQLQGSRNNALEVAVERLRDAAEEDRACAVPLADARRALLAVVSAEARTDLDDYVLRQKHGRQVKAENFAANRSQHVRRLAALVERICHADGIRHQSLWQKYAFRYDETANTLTDSTGKDLATITTDLQAQVDELTSALRGKNEDLLERVVLEELVGALRGELNRLRDTVRDVNGLMEDLRFGRSRYRIDARLKGDFRRLHDLLRKSSAIGASARDELREYFSSRLDQFTSHADGELPPVFDYRAWYDFNLRVSALDDDGVVLSQERLRQGSGGEQAVPSYLLLICLTKLLYDGVDAVARVLLLDEAFYGIDAGRRDGLLRFAERAGISLIIATPEVDGVSDALRASTTILIEKTASDDIYLFDVHFARKEPSFFEEEEPPPEAFVLGGGTHDAGDGGPAGAS